MDATRKIGASYSHALCLFLYAAYSRLHCYTDIHAIYYSFRDFPDFIGCLHSPLLPSRKRRTKMVFDFKSNQETALITILGTKDGYQPTRPGFFLAPADIISNNERFLLPLSQYRNLL
jgi:hypothetical protein